MTDQASTHTVHLAEVLPGNHPDDAPKNVPVLAYYKDNSKSPEVLRCDDKNRWWPVHRERCICIKHFEIRCWIYIPKAGFSEEQFSLDDLKELRKRWKTE